MWSADHVVIDDGNGRAPSPGIIVLGRITGDVSIFDRPGSVSIQMERLP